MAGKKDLRQAIADLVFTNGELCQALVRMIIPGPRRPMGREAKAMLGVALKKLQRHTDAVHALLGASTSAHFVGFNLGLAAALTAAGRQDILEHYPEAEVELLLLEAQINAEEGDEPPVS